MNEKEKPVRLDLLVQPNRTWFYVLIGAFLGAAFEIILGIPLAIIFRSIFGHYYAGKPLRLQYLLTQPLRTGEWPAISFTGLVLGAFLGLIFNRLRQNQKRLQGLKEEFEIQVAAMRHHYKNLAFGISGFSDRARRKLEKLEEQILDLPNFEDNTELEALRRSVHSLLATSKSLSTALTDELILLKALQSCELPPQPQNFLPILQHVIQELLELRFQDKEISVRIDGKSFAEPAQSLIFAFEPHTMEIILQNILSNAMRFADTIEIQSVANSHMVKIEITDNGPGFELDKLKANLIGENSRIGAESTQLGLRVTLYLLDKCGGKLYAASKSGEGASFILEFPRQAIRKSLVV
jgi:signal transduction histidine kinase